MTSMLKNVASQHVAAQMNSRTDGSPLTGPGTGMEGGCHTNTFMGVATCTVYCNPTNPNCPAGMVREISRKAGEVVPG